VKKVTGNLVTDRKMDLGVGPPLVSIAIAAYNRAHLIGRTLDSLLRQSVDDFEIIISDDASSDATREVCERYAAADERIRYSRNEHRLGLGGNCSRVLSMTCGEFVVLAGDDDIYEPTFLERLLGEMRRDPSLSIVACRVDLIDADDAVVRKMSQHFADEPASSPLRSAHRMLWRGYGNLMTGMYRREHTMRTWLYRPAWRDDWEAIDLLFLFEMAMQGGIISIPDILLHKRIGGISSSQPPRTLVEALVLRAAVARAYAARIRRSALAPIDKTLLYASLTARSVVSLWEWKDYLADLILTVLDPKRRVRRHFRRSLKNRVVKYSGE
jgi:glycosyltransferase involved in cell wall biosynthesis